MKTVFTILAVASLFVGCTPEPIENNDSQYYGQLQSEECGTIVSYGEDQRGDYIEVRMDYQKPYEKNRYKVTDYKNYIGKTKICDFTGLIQEQL